MKKELKDLKKGDEVHDGGCSGFCDDTISKVVHTSYKYDEHSGVKYKIIHLDEGRLFDSRTGKALTPPTEYSIYLL